MAETNGSANGTAKHFDTVPLIIDGEDVVGPNSFTVHNPAGGDLWQAAGASLKEVSLAVESAQAAFPAWSRSKPATRRDIFLRAANIFEKRRPILKQLQREETGAEDGFIDWIINVTVEDIRGVASKTGNIAGSIPGSDHEGRNAFVLKDPYGVILSIAPWNAPWPLGERGIAYALAAANTVVLKGSELSPRCFYEIVSIFNEAGLPKGVLNLVFSKREDSAAITEALIAHPSIKKLNFTGSTAVGSIISSLAGKYLKPIVTELGGKASTIVLADADIEKAAHAATLSAFLHAGQVCMATERLIVHASIADKFTEAFKKSTETLYGSPDKKPLFVTAAGATKTKKLVRDALSNGAEVVMGDPKESTDLDESSFNMGPIILKNVNKSSDIYLQESFGPSVVLYTFETEEEALTIANDTEYGLAGAVWTKDLAAGLRVARGYETGAVHINSLTLHQEGNLPHGGYKNSGFGSSTGTEAINEYLRNKVVTFDDF